MKKTERYTRRLAGLKTARSSWEPHWRDLSDWLLPRRGSRLHGGRVNNGGKINSNIVDSAGTLALRTMRAGMSTGLTSPTRPWFRLGTPDPGLQEFQRVKEWLEAAQDVLREIFNRSNLYTALPQVYEDLGAFGTADVGVFDDPRKVCRYQCLPVGAFYIAQGPDLIVNTHYREFALTVEQMVRWFGYDNCPKNVQDMARNGQLDDFVDVIHAVEPRDVRDPRKMDAQNMAWASCYLTAGETTAQHILRESGFQAFPFCSPRWDLGADDIYGRSPGMDALGDVRQLQKQTRVKQKAIEKHVDPPLVAPASMRGKPIDLTAGGVTYQDLSTGGAGLVPAYQVSPNISGLTEDMRETRDRIREAFYSDLFRAILQSQDRDKTAYEVARMEEEKLILLGPVLERLHGELLGPVIDLTFDSAHRAGLLPPPPPELQGMPLRVEFISILDQAQELVGLGGVDRLTQFVLGLSQAVPSVLDKYDADQAIDEYGRMLGVPSKVIRTDDAVEQMRKAQAAQAEERENTAMMLEMAKASKGMPAPPTPGEQAELAGIEGIARV